MKPGDNLTSDVETSSSRTFGASLEFTTDSTETVMVDRDEHELVTTGLEQDDKKSEERGAHDNSTSTWRLGDREG